jgi:hypothetical protein
MTEPKWTPGPWQTIMHNGSPREERQFADASGRPLGICHPHVRGGEPAMWEAKANARLIAAAPELYDALLYVFEHIADKERGPLDLYPAFGLDASRALEMCRGALAKARGEP